MMSIEKSRSTKSEYFLMLIFDLINIKVLNSEGDCTNHGHKFVCTENFRQIEQVK